MKKINHLIKMCRKVYQDRGLTSLFHRIYIYLKDFGQSLVLIIRYFNADGDVLYVSGCPGGSRFYRCENQAEELHLAGLRCFVTSQNNPALKYLLEKFSIIVFQRVIYNEYIGNVIEKAKKTKKKILFETDDLVFSSDYISHMDYFSFMQEEEQSWYRNGIGREILEDEYVKDCIVSTDYLAQELKKKYPQKNIFVSTNKMSKKQVSWAQDAYLKKNLYQEKDGKIRIGYFSGSNSHNKDFSVVSSVLIRILKENPQVILMLVGHLDVGDQFELFQGQIERHPFVSLKDLPKLMLKVDINIAPLEINNPFCQAKSALKFFEIGILGIPTVATATDSFKKVIDNGKNGFLAEKEDQWYQSLSELIRNQILRHKIGQQARVDTIDRYTVLKKHADTKKLATYFKSFLSEVN